MIPLLGINFVPSNRKNTQRIAYLTAPYCSYLCLLLLIREKPIRPGRWSEEERKKIRGRSVSYLSRQKVCRVFVFDQGADLF
jgi:hypothetical protein